MARFFKNFLKPKKKMLCPFCHKGRFVFQSTEPNPTGRTVRRYYCPVCGAVQFK